MARYDTGLFPASELPQSFGQALRYLRRRAGLTQSKLGELAGIDQSNISDIERGEVLRPTPETLDRLAAALTERGVNVTGHELEQLAVEFQFEVPAGGDGMWTALGRRVAGLSPEVQSQLHIAVSAMITALEIASRE